MVQGGKVGVALKGKRLRRAALAALMLTSSLGMVGVAAPAQAQEAARDFDIPAQPLANALTAFGQQSGLQVSAQAPLIEGRTSSAVRGALPPLQALSQLLTGTGLSFRIVGSTVTLEPAPQSADGTIQLGPVRVEGDSAGTYAGIVPSLTSDPAATEGTKSYTTRIMSTATGMPLSIRETPQSVSVLTRNQMDDLNIVSLNDAVSNVPGLISQPGNMYGDSAQFISRGFQVDTIMIDGLPFQFLGSFTFNGLSDDMAFYDRVEVLRGANGLLQGSGNPSAAINLIRKRPTYEPQGRLMLTAGSWNNFRADADVSGPLNDGKTIRGRLVTAYQDKDSYVDVINSKTTLLYGILEFDLSPDTLFTVGGTLRDLDGKGFDTGLPSNVDGSDMGLARSLYLGNAFDFEDRTDKSAFAEVRHDFGSGWEARLQGNIQAMNAEHRYSDRYRCCGDDLYQLYEQYAYRQRRYAADLRVSGSYALFGRAHEIIMGVNWQKLNSSAAGGWNPDAWTDGYGVIVDPYNWDPYANDLPYIEPNLWQFAFTSKQLGFYANTKINVTDGLGIILGSRISYYKYDSESYNRHYKVSGRWTPYAGITYDIDRNHTVYASYTNIFQPQSVTDKNGDLLKPLSGNNYEAGLKGEYFDGLLNLSASVFLIRERNRAVDDLTSQNPCPGTSRGWCQRAAGEVESKGFELEASGEITENLSIVAGYSFAVAKYRKDDTASLIGQRTDYGIPKHQVKVTGNYTLPGDLDRWNVGASLRYQSRIYRPDSEMPGQDGYVLVDTLAGYKLNDKVNVSLNVYNIFDKYYWSNIGYYTDNGRRQGAPRSAVLRVNYAF